MVEMAGAFVPAHQPADDLAVDEGGRRKVDHELRAVGDDPFHLIFQPGHRRHIVFAVNREHPRIALADEPGGSALRERRPLDFCQIRHTPLVMALHDPPSDRKPLQEDQALESDRSVAGNGPRAQRRYHESAIHATDRSVS